MAKIIIDNRSIISDIDVLESVGKVIAKGRISGKQYCGITVVTAVDKSYKYGIWTFLNAKSDRFVIIDLNK